MNPERLLQHFDRISEAPDAIPRLRQFILDLAVRGKLVEQDPNDEPAGELLKRVEAQKEKLITAGKIRKQQSLPKNQDDSRDLWIPSSWKAVELIDIVYLRSGIAVEYGDEMTEGQIPYVKVADLSLGANGNGIVTSSRFIGEKYSDSIIESGSIVFPKRGGAIATNRKRLSLVEIVCDSNLMAMKPFLCETTDYLQLWFSGFDLWKLNSGTSVPQINNKDIYPLSIPLPPLAEQHRIVAKVGELMALCDQLEAAKTEREQSRDRLVAASLYRLNQPADTEEANALEAFHDHARFYFNHLPHLTTRPEHIKQLRQTILNLAVCGKLVPQDPNDEPVLGTAILSKVARGRPVVAHEDEEDWLYGVPVNWGWCRLEGIAVLVTDGEHATPPRISERQVPLVTAKNVRDGTMDYSITDWVSFETADKAWRRCRPIVGDILLVCVGATTGRLCILREPKDMVLVRSVALIRPSNAVDVGYLALVIRSPVGQSQIWSSVKVTAQPCLYINRTVVPGFLIVPRP